MYKLSPTNDLIRLADGACIPRDEGNADYQRFVAWQAQGNAPQPADPPPPPTQDELDAAAARAYPKLAALAGMTPAQVDAWVTANVTNFAQAQDAIKTLAIGLSVLARRM